LALADIVLSAGTAHGPLLALELEFWVQRAEDEMASSHRALNTMDGRFLTYKELLAEVGDRYGHKNTREVFALQSAASQAALDRLSAELRSASPDVVVLIGNDQDELFGAANIPALAIFHGATVRTHKRNTAGFPEWRKRVSRASGMDRVREYRGSPSQARELIRHLIGQGFDISAIGDVPNPESLGFGHAYGFVAERLFDGDPPPLIPVLVNTITALNTPSPRRCLDFGRALRRAIADMSDTLRVAVIASGGLSHFICEEALDRSVLAALSEGRASSLADLPEPALSSGSSEIRSWIVLGGIMEGRPFTWSEYVPVHRTPAGSGIGMAWAVWH
jgi:hypothetical protein